MPHCLHTQKKLPSNGKGPQKRLMSWGFLHTDTKDNAFFLASSPDVSDLTLPGPEWYPLTWSILLRGRTNYLTPARHSPRIFVNLLMFLCSSPKVSKIFPFPSPDSSTIFGNLFMYLFPARNFPLYSPSLAWNSSNIFKNLLLLLSLSRCFPGYFPSPAGKLKI